MSATTIAGITLGSDDFSRTLAAELDATEQLIVEQVSHADGLLLEESLHLLQAGGKRFRPLFTILAAQFGPHPHVENVRIAAGALELTHLATLYHDDVMDEASSRRGAPSANARWGNSVAILAGDYLFARASLFGAQLGPHAVKVLARTFGELVTGQMRETKGAGDKDPVEHYLQTIWEKTASLIATCGYLGGLQAGLSEEQAQRLYRIGSAVGMAFQISDDIIDINSVQEQSGKVPGTDLREGVYTLPVLYALADDDADADRLRSLLELARADSQDSETAVAEALGLLRNCDAMARAQAVVRDYADQALADLAAFPEGEARASFEALIEFTISRAS